MPGYGNEALSAEERQQQISKSLNHPEKSICMKYQALALVLVLGLSECGLTRYAAHPVGGLYTLAGAGVANAVQLGN